jgi:UDP-N-acetylglucosamine 2-epimerase (non-hydrolysing)
MTFESQKYQICGCCFNPGLLSDSVAKLDNPGMRILSIIGTRPETIKMVPIIKVLENTPNVISLVVASGQHNEMVAPLLETFELNVDIDLKVMTHHQSLSALTARLVESLGAAINMTKPDWILVQGDTTTALAASMVGFYHKIPVGHVEAGLRTHERYRPFLEELNCKMIGSLGSIQFSPTPESAEHLYLEGIHSCRTSVMTGNTVIDAIQ